MGRPMTTIRLKYIKEYVRNGQAYRYFRRKGRKDIALPGQPGSREFNAAYEAALTEKPIPASRHAAGTVGKLVTEFYGSVEFDNLKPNSRKAYRSVLDPLSQQHGHRLVREMGRDNARKIIEAIGKTKPGMGNLARSVLKLLMSYAVARDWRNDNPVVGIKSYKGGTRHTWTELELCAYEARWPIGTPQRLDYASLLYSGQRGGDVVRMVRPGPSATNIVVRQQKARKGTIKELTIPVHPEWRAIIKETPSRGLSLIGGPKGRPVNRDALTLRIRRAAEKAGLPPECKAHGLRKALMRRMAEKGKSTKQMAAVSGHATLKELERYTEAADQVRLAKAAMKGV